MTDKEIIIDSVDVSECKSFSRGITNNLCKEPQEVDEECKYNTNCYFKQLKRAGQNAKDTYEMWQACIESLNIARQELSNAEQKLERIKCIVTDLLPLTNEYDNCYHKDECNKCDKVCQYRFVDKILQIVEGEENV